MTRPAWLERLFQRLIERAKVLELCLATYAVDFIYLRYGGIGIVFRELYRQPGLALEMMASDKTNWRVLMDPIPDSFHAPAGFYGPLSSWAYGDKWWFFYRGNVTGEKSALHIAAQLRARRPPCFMDILLRRLRPEGFGAGT